MSSLNRQSLGEEIANAVSHGIGALLAVLGTVVLIVYASYNSSVSGIVSAAIYGFCLIFLYLSISLIKIAEFHSLHKSTQKTDRIICRDQNFHIQRKFDLIIQRR